MGGWFVCISMYIMPKLNACKGKVQKNGKKLTNVSLYVCIYVDWQ